VVDKQFERRLAGLVNSGERGVLRGGAKGVEKESLRVDPAGRIVQTRHPADLGAPLTNEHITTDFSESLIELVTPPFQQSWELLQYLCDIHQFVYRHLGDELLWATSMPCALDGEDSIPLAQFGSSNVGRMKTIYRRGLGLRYGRIMQAISGVHFNYSFSAELWDVLGHINQNALSRQDFISEQYFGVLRNYRRYGWLVLYLFGTSPAVSKGFFAGRDSNLPELDADTLYQPYATSLRMSDIGYRNKNQASVSVSVNSLSEYVRDLSRATGTPYPPYEQIGVKVDGEYRQLNANILQIENEYYSFIRPKRVARSGERPTHALRRAGVEYVEVRALDVSAFDPVGVNQNKLRFLEAFLALCLLRGSEPIGRGEQDDLDANHLTVAMTDAGRRCRPGPGNCSTRCKASVNCSITASRSDPTRPRSSNNARSSTTRREHRRRDCSPRCARPANRSSIWRCACRSCTRIISWDCIRQMNAASGNSPRPLRTRTRRSAASRPPTSTVSMTTWRSICGATRSFDITPEALLRRTSGRERVASLLGLALQTCSTS
jgi:glutamate--cysteine ligase